MKIRILLFEDKHTIRRPICVFLRARGYEVLDFPSPTICPLVVEGRCSCSHDHACADLIITDMNMPGMSGLDLIRMMAEKGCHIPERNKIVISSSLTSEQQDEFRTYGCHLLPKPFQLEALWKLIQLCEKDIAQGRQLVPLEELWQTIRNHH